MSNITKPIAIINTLLEEENILRKQNQSKKYIQVDRLFWFIVVFPAILGISIAIFAKFTDLPWLYTTCISSVGLSYIGYIIYVISTVLTSRHKIKEFAKNPLQPQLNNASTAIEIDHKYLPQLEQCTILSLEIVQLELKAERDALERRTGLAVGTIEKLGIVPGILTTALAYQKIESAESLANQIVFALTFSLPFLYIMGTIQDKMAAAIGV